MERRRINGKMLLPIAVLLMWMASICISTAAPTVVLDETFDSVADVTYTTDTVGPIVNTDAGNWTYSLPVDGGVCGFSGGKMVKVESRDGSFDDTLYGISHTNPVALDVDSYATITLSYTMNCTDIGDNGGRNYKVHLWDSDKDEAKKYSVLFKGDTRTWAWWIQIGTTNGLITPDRGGQVAHEFQVSAAFSPQGDGTTNVQYDIVDLTDGSGSLSGMLNVADEMNGNQFDTSYLYFGTRSLGSLDNWKITAEAGSSSVKNWRLFD